MPMQMLPTPKCWQHLARKFHDPAQSFVSRSYTMHELRNQRFYWLVAQYGVNNYCVLCRVKA